MIFLLQIQEGSEPWDTKDEAPEDPGAGVTGSYEDPCGSWDQMLVGPLEEQYMLLTMEIFFPSAFLPFGRSLSF